VEKNDKTDMEVEVKFYLQEPYIIRERILATGAPSDGRAFESNIRFDTPDGLIRKGEALLRLRKDRRATLTYKSRPKEKDTEFKVHRELEIEVSDHDTTRCILEALGYRAVQVYEKYRETFHFDRAVICLDTMPFGEFLEIEGERDAIYGLAGQFGLNWQRRILSNYLELFDMLRHEMKLSFEDLTFENFRGVVLDPSVFAR
jgi:adenylate cyclase, class 2